MMIYGNTEVEDSEKETGKNTCYKQRKTRTT